MKLNDEEYHRVEWLLAHESSLDDASRQELRTLLKIELPALEDKPWADVVHFGLILVGSQVLYEAVKRSMARAPS